MITAIPTSVLGMPIQSVAVGLTAFRIHTNELIITPSIGISLFPAHGQNAQTLLNRADAAMYSAKKQGPNNFQVFPADMKT